MNLLSIFFLLSTRLLAIFKLPEDLFLSLLLSRQALSGVIFHPTATVEF